jgi:hypothetical protein
MDGRYLTQFACSSFFWRYTIISTAILQRVHILPNWRANPTTWKDWHVPQKKETVECWEVTIWSNSHLFTCQTHVIVWHSVGFQSHSLVFLCPRWWVGMVREQSLAWWRTWLYICINAVSCCGSNLTAGHIVGIFKIVPSHLVLLSAKLQINHCTLP